LVKLLVQRLPVCVDGGDLPSCLRTLESRNDRFFGSKLDAVPVAVLLLQHAVHQTRSVVCNDFVVTLAYLGTTVNHEVVVAGGLHLELMICRVLLMDFIASMYAISAARD
jgi:hypothetical protein